MGSSEKKSIVVYAALAADLGIAAAKFFVAAISGSSAMLSAGIHSTVDSGSELFLLLGLKRSKLPPDETHPYGHGKELYFWSLIAALVIFSIGGGMSIYEGIRRLVSGGAVGELGWSVAVLGFAFVFDGTSFGIGVRRLYETERNGTLLEKIENSKDPSVFTVVVEDGAALAGLLIAFAGVLISDLTGSIIPDALAAITIGVLLACVAVFLARESQNLLVGERASSELVAGIRELTERDAAVQHVSPPLTMQLSPDDVLVNLEIQFRSDVSAQDLAGIIDRMETRIRTAYPEVRRIFIEATALVPLRAKP